MKLKTAATLVLIRPDKMTAEGRQRIARWLRRQASFFQRHGKNYNQRFTANYRYVVR